MIFNIYRRFLHLLYPTRCPICNDFIGYNNNFCKKCEASLTLFEDEYSVSGTDGFCAAFAYDENISPAIMLLKDGICGNADFALGNSLAYKLKFSGFDKIDLIIPVPIHRKTLRKRGYNQSYLIAKQVGRALNIPVSDKAVIKNRLTRQQKELSKSEREINLKDSFSVVKTELVRNKNILILDDVCTTGSTLSELANTLKSASPNKIYSASCCKTPLL